MTISNLNLNSIEYQSALRSKPVSENFTDIQNKMNEQNAAIAALSTASSGAEVSAARDYHTDLQRRLQSASKGQGNIVITGGAVTQQSTPDMTVAVAAGEALVNGVACKWAAQNSGTITAPSVNPRYDVVVVNSDSTLSIVAGSEAASPVLPSISSTQKPLAILTLVVSQTSIVTADIQDVSDIVKKLNRKIYTSSGWFIRKSTVDYVNVTCIGKGGNGGTGWAGSGETHGGGGGGAGAVRKCDVAITDNVYVTIDATQAAFGDIIALSGSDGSNASAAGPGAGGAGGGYGAAGGGGGGFGQSGSANTKGGDGGDYGEAGEDGGAHAPDVAAAGGATTGSGSIACFEGGAGATYPSSTGYGSGAGGGAGYGGAGGAGGVAGSDGQDGQGFGAGGGGGGGFNPAPTPAGGGAGGAAAVILEWYE